MPIGPIIGEDNTADFSDEATSKKSYEFEGGNKLHVERVNPYGLVRIHAERGAVPPQLDGMYTSYDEADKMIARYILDKAKVITDVKVRG